MTEIIILGSGTCVPSLRRAGPATCLRTDETTLLIDSAAGTLRQLVRAGIPYDSVDYILYTHLHPDHVGEFVPFIFATKYAPGYKRTTPVTIFAAEGFKQFHEALKKGFGEWVEPEPEKVIIEEIPVHLPSSIQIPPLTIKCAHTLHTPQSLVYRIESPDGTSAVFSGDTDYCSEIIELAQGADILVLECASPEHKKVQGHLTPSEAGKIAREAGVKKLVLTHFYPECDDSDMLTECKRIYDGPIILAEDFMRVIV